MGGFSDGSVEEADILVAADGARSLIRKQRLPSFVHENLHINTVGSTIPAKKVEELVSSTITII